jgi:hypothetical protein
MLNARGVWCMGLRASRCLWRGAPSGSAVYNAPYSPRPPQRDSLQPSAQWHTHIHTRKHAQARTRTQPTRTQHTATHSDTQRHARTHTRLCTCTHARPHSRAAGLRVLPSGKQRTMHSLGWCGASISAHRMCCVCAHACARACVQAGRTGTLESAQTAQHDEALHPRRTQPLPHSKARLTLEGPRPCRPAWPLSRPHEHTPGTRRTWQRDASITCRVKCSSVDPARHPWAHPAHGIHLRAGECSGRQARSVTLIWFPLRSSVLSADCFELNPSRALSWFPCAQHEISAAHTRRGC